MFDFENPFKDAIDQAEEEILDEEFDEATAEPDWENAEWEKVYGRPARNVAMGTAEYAEMKAAHAKEKQEMFEHFHIKAAHRKKERTLIDALRYAGIAAACGLLSYVCGDHGIRWLTWILGIAGFLSAIVSSYGFGKAHEMGR